MDSVSKDELKFVLKKHEERETPAQEKAESGKEQKIEQEAGVEKQALFGLWRPEVTTGFDKKRKGVIAQVRHNFTKKDVLPYREYDEDKQRVGGVSDQFYSLTSGGGLHNFSKRENKKMLEDPKFQNALSDYKKMNKVAFWHGFLNAQKGTNETQ